MQKKILFFTVSRYIVYVLLFLRGLLLAKLLGPTLFGIWGFLMLVQRYVFFANMGIPLAINLELAAKNKKFNDTSTLIPESFTLILLISLPLFIIGLFIFLFKFQIFVKYSFPEYSFLIIVLGILSINKEFFSDIYQVFGDLERIAFYELLSAVSLFGICFFYEGEDLIYAQLVVAIITGLLGQIFFLVKKPFKLTFKFNLLKIKHILNLGFSFFLSTTSFYLMILSIGTVISIYYTVEQMGFYSFASRMAVATLLGFNAITWAIYPKILSKLNEKSSDEETKNILKLINDLYNTFIYLISFIAIILIHYLFLYLPKYKPSESILSLLIISQIIYSVGFGYLSFANVKRKQYQIAGYAILILVSITLVSLTIASIGLNIKFIVLSLMLGYFIYVLLIVRLGSNILRQDYIKVMLTQIISPGSFISILIIIIGVFLSQIVLSVSVALIVFMLTNKKRVFLAYSFLLNQLKRV